VLDTLRIAAGTSTQSLEDSCMFDERNELNACVCWSVCAPPPLPTPRAGQARAAGACTRYASRKRGVDEPYDVRDLGAVCGAPNAARQPSQLAGEVGKRCGAGWVV
jgi:hypothetical protein